MNEESVAAWLHDLATTTEPQAKNRLTAWVLRPNGKAAVLGYCCLGRAEVVRGAHLSDSSLAPRALIEWLGIDLSEHDTQCTRIYPGRGCRCEFDIVTEIHTRPETVDASAVQEVSAADMNDDWGLTFSQIADVFRYFGITGVRQ